MGRPALSLPGATDHVAWVGRRSEGFKWRMTRRLRPAFNPLSARSSCWRSWRARAGLLRWGSWRLVPNCRNQPSNRLVRTLLMMGYVRQLPNRHYALGPKLIRLGESAAQLIGVWSRPHMAELVERTGETANTAVLDYDMAVYVAQVPSPHTIRMFTERVGASTRTAPVLARRFSCSFPTMPCLAC